MVGASEIAEQFDIPRATLYRLVDLGAIPAHEVTRPWHKRRQYRFKVSEVRAALDEMAAAKRARERREDRSRPRMLCAERGSGYHV